jgi:hypothetical protein
MSLLAVVADTSLGIFNQILLQSVQFFTAMFGASSIQAQWYVFLSQIFQALVPWL